MVLSSDEARRNRPRVALQGFTVFPYRWFTHDKRMKQDRQATFNLFTASIMVPAPKQLFEDFPGSIGVVDGDGEDAKVNGEEGGTEVDVWDAGRH